MFIRQRSLRDSRLWSTSRHNQLLIFKILFFQMLQPMTTFHKLSYRFKYGKRLFSQFEFCSNSNKEMFTAKGNCKSLEIIISACHHSLWRFSLRRNIAMVWDGTKVLLQSSPTKFSRPKFLRNTSVFRSKWQLNRNLFHTGVIKIWINLVRVPGCSIRCSMK